MPYYDGRSCHPLVLWEGEGYRVYRTKWAKIEMQRLQTYSYSYLVIDLAGKTNERKQDTRTRWEDLGSLDAYYSNYVVAKGRAAKLVVNRKWAEKGAKWITHWRELLEGELWEVRCNSWDGQGTICPLQRDMPDGEPGCPYTWSLHGYVGSPRVLHVLPGKCDGPLNWSYSLHPSVPTRYDAHGLSMTHLAKIRHEIWKRGQDGHAGFSSHLSGRTCPDDHQLVVVVVPVAQGYEPLVWRPG